MLDVYCLPRANDGTSWVDVLVDAPLSIQVRMQPAEKVTSAVWRGEPFLVVGAAAELDEWFAEHDEISKSMLMDCAYWWVLTKNSDYHHKLLPNNRIAALTWRAHEHNIINEALNQLGHFPKLAGLSNRMQHLRERIRLIAEGEKGPSRSVLILGPTGSGKEVVAQALFANSDRGRISNRMGEISGSLLNTMDPAIAFIELFGVDLGVFQNLKARRGLVDIFSEGALFVDDFESAPRNVQEALLRVMAAAPGQHATYRKHGADANSDKTNVWLIFATNGDIDRLIKQERLREDFLFRFEDVLLVPSLRQRPSDFPAIAYQIWRGLHQDSPAMLNIPVLSWQTIRKLVREDLKWEGNVRQLQMLLKLAAKMKTQIAHRNRPVDALVEEITSRGPTFRDWLGVLGSDVYSGSSSSSQRLAVAAILEMDSGHVISGLTPCEVDIRNRLNDEQWGKLQSLVNKQAGGKPERRRAILQRFCRYLLFAIRNEEVTKGDAADFGDVEVSQAAKDLDLLAAEGRFLSLLRRKPVLCFASGSYFTAPGGGV